MWRRISDSTPELADRAFKLLAKYRWVKTRSDFQRLLSRQEVFYMSEGERELLAGFELSPADGVWRIASGSFVGPFTLDSANAAIDLLISFAAQKKVGAIYATTAKRDPLHITEVIYRAIREAAVRHPKISSVRSQALGPTVLWEFSFK
jgi:hypothetical protein